MSNIVLRGNARGELHQPRGRRKRENKKTAFLIRMKTKILNVQDTFSQISLSSLHDLLCQT